MQCVASFTMDIGRVSTMRIDHTLDQLQALDAIARTGSFAAAAAALHRVPSAVSYAIKGLEQSLEVELFDRSRRKAVLTPAGRKVLEQARKVLGGALQLQAMALEIRDGWEPELQVVVDGVYPMGPIIDVLRLFSERQIPTSVRLDV